MVWLVFKLTTSYSIDRCSPTFFGLSGVISYKDDTKKRVCHPHCTWLWVSLDVAHPTEAVEESGM